MTPERLDPREHIDALRVKAVTRLVGEHVPQDLSWNGANALRALYDLACVPATTPDALALLHELQVHQVEVELQAEQLQGTSVAVDQALQQQLQRYDCVPVGLCTIDAFTTLLEVNATAADQLGASCDDLLGQPLYTHLTAQGGLALRAMLTQVGTPNGGLTTLLALLPASGEPRRLHARVGRDAVEGRYLLALMDA